MNKLTNYVSWKKKPLQRTNTRQKTAANSRQGTTCTQTVRLYILYIKPKDELKASKKETGAENKDQKTHKKNHTAFV